VSDRVRGYFEELGRLPLTTRVSDSAGVALPLEDALLATARRLRAVHDAGGKLMFVGNGGSAGIASHCAIDFAKNGGLRALCFNDGAALTCLANDLGFEQVFAHPVALHANPGDALVAISSAGSSANILGAVAAARARRCHVITMSGFAGDNPLRALGDLNYWVESSRYGFVEVTHLALCHALLDLNT
jgi:D-sedoheptulose 7-phosphate isomerase